MTKIFLLAILCISSFTYSQDIIVKSDRNAPWRKIYRAENTKVNDLVNTKLDVKFDFSKSWMYGKAWLTL